MIECVSHQLVVARDNGHGRLDDAPAAFIFNHVAAPQLHERAVAEQAQVLRAAPFRVFLIGRCFRDFDPQVDLARRDVAA